MTEPSQHDAPQEASPLPSAAPSPVRSPARILQSTELLQGEREVVIVHQGEEYRLRLTRNDRLVLYK